jgi:predicted RNase H-like nuclease (RuvC/YqgF family)
MNSEVIDVILAILSGGAIVAIINGIFNKRKSNAESTSIELKNISDAYSLQKTMLEDSAKNIIELQCKVEALEQKVDALTIERNNQIATIQALTDENIKLKKSVSELQTEISNRDTSIKSLQKRVKELETRISQLTGGAE